MNAFEYFAPKTAKEAAARFGSPNQSGTLGHSRRTPSSATVWNYEFRGWFGRDTSVRTECERARYHTDAGVTGPFRAHPRGTTSRTDAEPTSGRS